MSSPTSLVRWATKPTCERVRYSSIVACLKYRIIYFKKKKSSSSIILPNKDPGSQEVLCTLKPFRLCIVVLMFVPPIDSAKKGTEQLLSWLAGSVLTDDLR